MTRAYIELDFARKRPRLNRRGAALLVLGVVGVAFVLADYQSIAARKAGLDLRATQTSSTHRRPKTDKATEQATQEARVAFAELTTPWSLLLRELELASVDTKGSVAVLGVEPDREKRQVRVLAEARSLPTALAYVERLQKSAALRYPMLESHEVQTKDPQRPVRFQIRADWSVVP
jgi:hypothetical protein